MNLSEDTQKEATELLRRFNFRTSDRLPQELVDLLADVSFAESVLAHPYVLTKGFVFFANQQLRADMVAQGCNDRTPIFLLYYDPKAMHVHYDSSGRRLGDELGINGWFLKEK